MSRQPSPGAKAGRYLTNSIGLGPKELIRLLDELDESAAPPGSVVRAHARWPFRAAALPVAIVLPGGSTKRILLACRNLSSGGAGYLHNAYMHPGTRCIVTLPSLSGAVEHVEGEVARCQHRRGVIHEVGIRFDKPLEMREFVAPDPMNAWFAPEAIDPDKLQGTLLHVEPVAADRAMMRSFLRDTLLRIRTAETGAEGISMATEGADILVLNHDLPDMSGAEFLSQLAGAAKIVTLITSSRRDDSIAISVARSGVLGFIPKPLVATTVRAAISEGIERARSGAIDLSSQDGILSQVLTRLESTAIELQTAVAANDADAIFQLCLQLKGYAPAVGLVDIGQLSELVVGALGQSKELGAIEDQLKELVVLCQSASSQRAA
ncbi:MAG: hypothetical protein CMJ31_12635 [Phycisphaerae bacterium]|nr:hypothetical protein [Phycisphaerae bacterium]